VDAVLVGLGSGQREHQTVGVLADLINGQGGEFAAAQRGEEPDQQQSPVTQAGQVGFGCAAGGFPGPGVGAGGQDVEQLGRHQPTGTNCGRFRW
jgi:hypothetical protein